MGSEKNMADNPSHKDSTAAPVSRLNLTTMRVSILALLFILVATLLTWQALVSIEAQISRDIQENLETILKTTHESLHTWIHGRIDGALTLVNCIEIQEPVKKLLARPLSREELVHSPSLHKLRLHIQPWLDRHQDLGMMIVAPDGRHIAASHDKNLGKVHTLMSHGDYLDNIMNGASELILPVPCNLTQVGTGKNPHAEAEMYIGVPIKDDNGTPMAAFVVRLDPHLDFSRIIQLANAGETGNAYAFDQRGLLLSKVRFEKQLRQLGLLGPDQPFFFNLHLNDPGGDLTAGFQPEKAQDQWPPTLGIAKALSKEKGSHLSGYRDYRGIPVVGAWVWLDHGNLGLIFEQDVADAYAPYFFIRRVILTLSTLLIILSVSLLLLAARQKKKVDAMNTILRQEVEERRQGEQKIRGLLEASPDALLIYHHQQEQILYANQQACEMFGFSNQDLLNCPLATILPEHALMPRAPHDVLHSDPNISAMTGAREIKAKRQDGSVFPVEIFVNAVTLEKEDAVIASIRDISRRKEIETVLEAREVRISRHKEALQELAKGDFSDLARLIRHLTETAAHALQVDRLSVWFFNEDRTVLVCSDLFRAEDNSHDRDMILKQADYPDYFKAIARKRVLAASTAQNDPDTREFTDDYLVPLGITSMLDVAILSHASLVGLLSCEHIGPARDWAPEELTFASSLADIITLALEVNERQMIQEELLNHKVNLEHVIKKRTADLSLEIEERKKAEEELRSYTEELERFRAISVDREQTMIRLKEEINALLVQDGKEAKYTIVT